ncbi:MAG: acetate kinase [Eubacteriales bacterium]|nr:acetate kinase [Eubacteriales bacterium]
MNILVINAGSSSLKYQLIEMDKSEVLAKGIVERIGLENTKITQNCEGKPTFELVRDMEDHSEAIADVIKALTSAEYGCISSMNEIDAVGHRVLHAGMHYSASTIITEDVKRVIRDCFDLGPLHNPANLIGIEACEKVIPGIKQVAVFDTAFGQSMDKKAYTYAIPYEYYEKYFIRRYGFHGISHMYVSNRTIQVANLDKDNAKVIVCHLGNGSSISASIGGKCVDTSMGLTPLEGLVMGTRSGDIDPAVVQFIANKENRTVDEVLDILNKKSGVLGISDISSDFRDLTNAAEEGNERARLALDMFIYRAKKYIGSYIAIMGGVDAIVFTAGIGENDKIMRKAIIDGFQFMNIEIDDVKNNIRGEEAIISTDASNTLVMVIPTNEELKIAQETQALM